MCCTSCMLGLLIILKVFKYILYTKVFLSGLMERTHFAAGSEVELSVVSNNLYTVDNN